MDFAVSANHRVKLKEGEKREKYLDLARELEKKMQHESDSDTNSNWCARYSHQRICKETGGLGKEIVHDSGLNLSEISDDELMGI